MDLRTTISLLLLLLGLCNAHGGKDHGTDDVDEEDVMTAILKINNGSSEFLLEGDLYIPHTRTAMRCMNDAFNCLWPKSADGNARVPYTLSEKYDNSETSAILNAMRDLESKSCIRFTPRNTERMYLSIEPRFGCFSAMGRAGDRQLVSLQKFGCISHGIIQHELLHALGFYHEHTRTDRDKYIKIIWDNIIDHYVYNFDKKDTNNLNTPYDYGSVMHYGRTAFGSMGAETLVPIPDSSVHIGQRDGMSEIDVIRLNRLYKCYGYSM